MLESKAFPIKKIYVPTNRRQTLDVEKVRQIAESILQKGQDTPIMVPEWRAPRPSKGTGRRAEQHSAH